MSQPNNLENHVETVPVSSSPRWNESTPAQLQQMGIGGWGLAAIIGVVLLLVGVKAFLKISNPNQILIISGGGLGGKKNKLGYRTISNGGLAFKLPIIQQAETMDLTTMPVSLEVTNAYAKGGTPLNIEAIANVKISPDPSLVGNAIERFLGRNYSEIKDVAKETLEGNLRGVVATLTPEQLNEDRLEFAQRISDDVTADLAKLGLQLDTLKIQSVSDDVDYLSSIGRQQIAAIKRDAEIAESDAAAEAEQTEADCNRQTKLAETEAETATQEKENELKRITAEVNKDAKVEEERTTAAAEEAKARAQQELQSVRSQLEEARLEVEQVLPADAERQANELKAKGDAAKMAEDTKASAQVNQILAKVWQETGVDAAELFLVQQMDMILEKASEVPNRLHLRGVTVIDNGDGKAIASLSNAYPEMIRNFLQQSEETLGIPLSGKIYQDLEQTDDNNQSHQLENTNQQMETEE